MALGPTARLIAAGSGSHDPDPRSKSQEPVAIQPGHGLAHCALDGNTHSVKILNEIALALKPLDHVPNHPFLMLFQTQP